MNAFSRIPILAATAGLVGIFLLLGLIVGLAGALAGTGGGGGGSNSDGSEYSGDCKADRIVYSGQYSESQLSKVFGPPRSEDKLTQVEALGFSFQVNKKIAPCLAAVERERKAKNINYEVESSKGGSGGYRPVDGQIGDRSYHVYGAAVDINPTTNPYCGSSVVGDASYCSHPEMPAALIKVFRNHGFTWGGDWNSVKDYMHFEWHGEKP
jgi:hypothetical protein